MAVHWEQWTDEKAARRWDAALSTFPAANVFQSYRWGEYKRASGWTPARWLASHPDGSIGGMAQILVKPLMDGFWFGWAPGGPLFSFGDAASGRATELIRGLTDSVSAAGNRFCLRVDCHEPTSSALMPALRETFSRALYPLNTGFALHLRIPPTMEDFLDAASAKHRYYVRKALKERLEWRAGNDSQSIGHLARLNAEMVNNKGERWLLRSHADIARLCDALGDSALILTGYADDGVPAVSCLVLVYEHEAYYWMAAAGSRGRALGASYAMVYRLVEYLHERKVDHFNFGGIAPGSRHAEGVNHFKRGFGGAIIENVGEWEYSTARWIRYGMNVGLWYRNKLNGTPTF